MKKFSRALAVGTVAFVGSASATGCPEFVKKSGHILHKNAILMTGTNLFESQLGKNEHAKKALLGTTLHSLDHALYGKKMIETQEFAHRFAVDLGIRKASDMIGLEGLRDAVLKKCDVLPAGPIRDNVKPVIDGAANFITHPETLTELAMIYVLPQVLG
jgi:hypothetical protein